MNLLNLRIQNGLTQSKLAKKIGYGQHAISTWEKGTREPNIATLCSLADVFNISLDELVGRDYKKVATQELTESQQNLIDKIKYLNDDQCLTLCNIIDTFGNNDNKQILSDYNQLKKYEDWQYGSC